MNILLRFSFLCCANMASVSRAYCKSDIRTPLGISTKMMKPYWNRNVVIYSYNSCTQLVWILVTAYALPHHRSSVKWLIIISYNYDQKSCKVTFNTYFYSTQFTATAGFISDQFVQFENVLPSEAQDSCCVPANLWNFLLDWQQYLNLTYMNADPNIFRSTAAQLQFTWYLYNENVNCKCYWFLLPENIKS